MWETLESQREVWRRWCKWLLKWCCSPKPAFVQRRFFLRDVQLIAFFTPPLNHLGSQSEMFHLTGFKRPRNTINVTFLLHFVPLWHLAPYYSDRLFNRTFLLGQKYFLSDMVGLHFVRTCNLVESRVDGNISDQLKDSPQIFFLQLTFPFDLSEVSNGWKENFPIKMIAYCLLCFLAAVLVATVVASITGKHFVARKLLCCLLLLCLVHVHHHLVDCLFHR